ncbi:2'-deamino-2'-hydroxyneamine transaminase [Serratia grimesii]|uniref:aminotransferase class III-fold pyridoxal phosphate-dependent enzyme n=1 Tax=Serratia grimesii TaxID=82995 RepID=UPI00076F39ED|nr:aminotransferase class III-fold pyridoxal phosphate-dependent enzyme [Serratia grimesii]CUW23775.1 2'-deamino-2'-hydroxyneamine transaminase [Serratia grimesii]SMZ58330.1 2'-deamino-2'-hydroxyneamine transaminase [Serratia grimesii]
MFSPLVGSDRVLDANGQPIQFRKGQGYRIEDSNGNQYLDFVLGIGPVILGHSHPEFNKRLTDALSLGLSFPGFGEVHSQVSDIFEEIYSGYKVVSLFKTSSEAVTASFRCAMMQTERKKILRCGFLGWHDAQLYMSPSWHEILGSDKRNDLRYLNGMRGVSGEEAVFNWVNGDLSELESLLQEHGNEIAIFALDVYQLAFFSEEKIKAAVAMCKTYGVKLLLDETKTAGRTNPGGYLANNTSFDPDYVVLGKAIGNGLPLAILMGKPDILSVYREARIGGTHTKEILSPHAAIAVAEIMGNCDGYNVVSQAGKAIVMTLNLAFKEAGADKYVNAKSLFDNALFDLVCSQEIVNNYTLRSRLKAELLKNGLLIMEGHNSFVSLAHSDLNHDELFGLTYSAAKSWVEAM